MINLLVPLDYHGCELLLKLFPPTQASTDTKVVNSQGLDVLANRQTRHVPTSPKFATHQTKKHRKGALKRC